MFANRTITAVALYSLQTILYIYVSLESFPSVQNQCGNVLGSVVIVSYLECLGLLANLPCHMNPKVTGLKIYRTGILIDKSNGENLETELGVLLYKDRYLTRDPAKGVVAR